MGMLPYMKWRVRMLLRGHRTTLSLRLCVVLVCVMFIGAYLLWSTIQHRLSWKLGDSSIDSDTQHLKTLPSTVVVEEHHEVLKYWFEAVHNGWMPDHGITLLHIDGHSDMASPQILDVPHFPRFRIPKTPEEVRLLMQSNDVFIQGTIMSGVINRTIWVWPSWDQASHEGDYEQYVGELGWIDATSPDGTKQQICACMTHEREGRECSYDIRETDETITITPAECHIRSKFYYEIVRDDLALQMLKQGKWLSRNEKLILDIDEDFFGVEEAMKLFYEVGFKWKFIESLSYELSIIFCPQNRAMDNQANKLLVHILKTTIGCRRREKPCNNQILNSMLEELIMSTVIEMFYSKKNQIFCAMYERVVIKQLEQISDMFTQLTLPQLKLLADVGFCLATTIKTINQDHEFGVCLGGTLPNNTVVSLHTPTVKEVDAKMSYLQNLLNDPHMPQPGLTTVCRSVRDGYTPKRFFRQIENGVLNVVSNVYNNKKQDVIYDEDLLGGSNGWLGRHRISNRKPV